MLLFASVLLGMLTLGASEPESLGFFRVRAQATNGHTIQIGANDRWVTVDGTGKTDLDCWLFDSKGQLVDSDTDGTDYCVLATADPGKYRLSVKNKGNVASAYAVRTAERLR